MKTWVMAVALAAAAHQAAAQTAATTDFQRGTTLAGFAGAAAVASRADLALGAGIGWELTPHFTIEGRGFWLDEGPNADAFAAVLGARVPLLAPRPVVPFVGAGAGLYRARFATIRPGMPRFYQRRMTTNARGSTGAIFDDFALSFTGGADVYLARHLALRPELTVLVVTTGSNARAVPVFGAQLAYHFEDRPITPAGRTAFGGVTR
jgi:hypothetical protein